MEQVKVNEIVRDNIERYSGIEGICDKADLRDVYGFDSLDIVEVTYGICEEAGVTLNDNTLRGIRTMEDITSLIMREGMSDEQHC